MDVLQLVVFGALIFCHVTISDLIEEASGETRPFVMHRDVSSNETESAENPNALSEEASNSTEEGRASGKNETKGNTNEDEEGADFEGSVTNTTESQVTTATDSVGEDVEQEEDKNTQNHGKMAGGNKDVQDHVARGEEDIRNSLNDTSDESNVNHMGGPKNLQKRTPSEQRSKTEEINSNPHSSGIVRESSGGQRRPILNSSTSATTIRKGHEGAPEQEPRAGQVSSEIIINESNGGNRGAVSSDSSNPVINLGRDLKSIAEGNQEVPSPSSSKNSEHETAGSYHEQQPANTNCCSTTKTETANNQSQMATTKLDLEAAASNPQERLQTNTSSENPTSTGEIKPTTESAKNQNQTTKPKIADNQQNNNTTATPSKQSWSSRLRSFFSTKLATTVVVFAAVGWGYFILRGLW